MEARQIIVCHFLGRFWTALSEGFRMKYLRDQMVWYMKSYMRIKLFWILRPISHVLNRWRTRWKLVKSGKSDNKYNNMVKMHFSRTLLVFSSSLCNVLTHNIPLEYTEVIHLFCDTLKSPYKADCGRLSLLEYISHYCQVILATV